MSPEKSLRDASAPQAPIGITVSPSETGPEHAPSVTLRPLEEGDRAWFLSALKRSRESVARWLPLNKDGESDAAFFDRQRMLCEEGDRTQKSFRRLGVLEDGTPAGFFALNSISRGLAWEADAIWWVDVEQRSRGIATAGVLAMLTHAFSDLPSGLGLHGVHCGIEEANAPSVRVAEKCGFMHDVSKRSHLSVGGRWVMHEFYIATPASIAFAHRASA